MKPLSGRFTVTVSATETSQQVYIASLEILLMILAYMAQVISRLASAYIFTTTPQAQFAMKLQH
jgi:hypothetical protein